MFRNAFLLGFGMAQENLPQAQLTGEQVPQQALEIAQTQLGLNPKESEGLFQKGMKQKKGKILQLR